VTPDQAHDLAARALAAIDSEWKRWDDYQPGATDEEHLDADRERVASDLALIRECAEFLSYEQPALAFCEWVGAKAEAGLRRTAALYGVTL
jgi:hypothetical protein